VTQRDRIVILVVVGIAALGAFWMLGLKPKRQEAAKLGKDLSTAQQRLNQAQSDLQAGQTAKASYSANYSTVARLGKAVPSDDDVPSLVYQLDSTANATGVDFRSVKLQSGAGSAPTTTTAANAAAATSDAAQGAGKESGGSGQQAPSGGQDASGAQSQPSGSASGSSPASGSGSGASQGASGAQPTSTSSSTSGGSAPAAATQTATAALPPGAVVGPAGLSTMPFSFRFNGSFFRLSDFLGRLERYIDKRRSSLQVSGRLLLINGISLSAAESGFPKMQASIAATAYLVPPQEGTFNGATPQGPSTPGAAQPAGNPAPAPAPAAPAATAAVKP
jgi:hypothetical protein